jgi:hypothetical protein
MTGLRRVTSRALARNRRPSSMLSTYPSITRVSGSSARYSMMSDSETSALFPRLTNFENPIPSPIAQSSTAVQSAPDCEKKEMFPLGGVPREKEALSEAWVLMSPRQFGPRIRIPASRAAAVSDRSSATPSPPTSLKPAEMAMAARIPLAFRRGIPSRMALGGTTKCRVHRAGDVADRAEEPMPEQSRGSPVDGTRKSRLDEVLENTVPDLFRVPGGPDHGDGPRMQKFPREHDFTIRYFLPPTVVL